MGNGGLHTSGSLLSILIKGQTHDCDSGTFNSEIPFFLLFSIMFYYRIEYSSMCYIVGFCCLSIL